MRGHSTAVVIAIGLLATTVAAAAQTRIFPNTDRRAANDRAVSLPSFKATLGNCVQACIDDQACRTFTFARSVKDGPNCWLNSGLPPGRPDGCCDSGRVH